MPRLGGGMYSQSYLINNGTAGSQTQVIDNGAASITSPQPTRRNDRTLPTTSSSSGGSSSSITPSSSTLKSRRVKAAESGSGSILPDYNTPSPRVRTFSDFSLRSRAESPPATRTTSTSPTETHDDFHGNNSSSSSNFFRRRGSSHFDEDRRYSLQRQSSMSSTNASLPLHTAPRRSGPIISVNKGFSIGHLLQSLVILTIFYLVYDAHAKVQEASLRLEHYKDEESLLINQMDRIEGRAMQLQEQLKRLREEQMNPPESPVEKTRAETKILQKEVQHWKRQADEVDKEVAALQDFMQHGARQEMANRYGQGSVHVDMTLGLGGSGPSKMTIELFDETPHAAWVWLQQIEKGDWSGANFIWHPSHMVLASPAHAATTKLEFVERTVHAHQAWTVGLTPSENGGYNLYINVQDNAHLHEGDVCLGKVVGGFDALQRLMHVDTVARQPGGEKTYFEPAISIADFGVSTVKRSRTQQRQ